MRIAPRSVFAAWHNGRWDMNMVQNIFADTS